MKKILFVFLAFSVLFSYQTIIAESGQQVAQSQYPPKINYFNADPPMATQGDSITLSWKTEHATDVYISGIGKVPLSGSRTIIMQGIDSLQNIILTAAHSNGNFAPATRKLVVKKTTFPTKVPSDYASPAEKSTKAAVQQPHLNSKLSIPKNSMAALTPPQVISPKNNSTFSHYPRTLKLRWLPVPNAATYTVEIDCMHCCAAGKWCNDVGRKFKHVQALQNTYYEFRFVGSQPGRWRVQAVDKNRNAGEQSQWHNFKFTR